MPAITRVKDTLNAIKGSTVPAGILAKVGEAFEANFSSSDDPLTNEQQAQLVLDNLYGYIKQQVRNQAETSKSITNSVDLKVEGDTAVSDM